MSDNNESFLKKGALSRKIVEMSIEATKDNNIKVAGDFQPKGLTWKRAAAAGAGSLLGSEASDGNSIASGLGASAGYMVGTYAGTTGNIPPVVVLAASPEKLYILTSKNSKGMIVAKELTLLDTLDRKNLQVEMHQKATVRTAVIKDSVSGHEYKIEGKRMLFHHMNALLDELNPDED